MTIIGMYCTWYILPNESISNWINIGTESNQIMKFVSTPSNLRYCLTAVSQHRQTWHWQAQNKIRALHIRALTDAGELPQLYKTHPDVSALAFHVTLTNSNPANVWFGVQPSVVFRVGLPPVCSGVSVCYCLDEIAFWGISEQSWSP